MYEKKNLLGTFALDIFTHVWICLVCTVTQVDYVILLRLYCYYSNEII